MAGKEIRRRLHPSDAEKDNQDDDSREYTEEKGGAHTAVRKQATNEMAQEPLSYRKRG